MAAGQRGLSNPTYQKAVAEGRVNLPGKVECIWQPLYDSIALPAAGAASLVFFQNPIGQAGKTLADTNMELSGQIPKGQNFLVTGVEVALFPGEVPDAAASNQFSNDVYNFYKAGALIFRIGAKDFLRQAPLIKFPPVNRLAGQVATGIVASIVTYIQAAGREFAVSDLMLESNQNFSLELQGLPAMPSGSAARIVVSLNGWLYRNAQ